MDHLADRVELDTRRYYNEQDKAAAEWADDRDARKWEALNDLGDPEKLKTVLNDADLALPLATCFKNLNQAVSGDALAVHAILSQIFRMQKSCYSWLLGDE